MAGKRYVRKWSVAAAGLLLLFLLPDRCTTGVKGLLKDSFMPVQHLVLKTVRSLKEGADTVRGFGGLAEENHRLSEEIVRLQARLRVLKNLEEENSYLSQQLDFRTRQTRDLIACRISARPVSRWWQSVRLNKGLHEGVESDRAVISSDGLVGRTAEVSAHTADVLLLSDPACNVSARVARTGSFGVVSGFGTNREGYPVARMQFIHKDIPVRTGDAVVTSGLGGVFPKDLLVGYINSVEMEETGLYQTAEIIPKAVVELMDVVFVAGGTVPSGEETP
jgi:rod shape-determining protein MreC